jgi:molybdopterin/thiamine biosynthesis adenylyltransferase
MEIRPDPRPTREEKVRHLNLLGEICLRVRDPAVRAFLARNWRDEATLSWQSSISSLSPLSKREGERYSRQILFAGEGSQQRLAAASVVVLGAGGVGAPCLYYLVGAGIGHIKIVDMDVVERSNLNRQVLYVEGDIGRQKVEAARARLLELNPDIDVTAVTERVISENAMDLIRGHDFVISALDDIFVVNEACARGGIPFAAPFATTSTFGGSLFVSGAGGRAPCYECVFNAKYNPKIGPDRTTGVFGFAAGVAGILAALEAAKHVLNLPRQLGTFTLLDLWGGVVTTFPIAPSQQCRICGK